VASPIVVNGRLWGAIAAGTSRAKPMPADAESRIADFTELVAAAISNVQARSDLAASSARIVAAADEERRRVVRAGIDAILSRLDLPAQMDVLAQRFPPEIEATAYSIVVEALTLSSSMRTPSAPR